MIFMGKSMDSGFDFQPIPWVLESPMLHRQRGLMWLRACCSPSSLMTWERHHQRNPTAESLGLSVVGQGL